MGDGYIRYDNGLQICWGTTEFDTVVTDSWGSMYEATVDGISKYTFSKAFKSTPWVSATSIGRAMFIERVSASTTSVSVTYIARATALSTTTTYAVDYIAIGAWK